MNSKDIKLDKLTLGPKGEKDDFILTDIKPDYAYADNKRTDNLIGYKYTIVLVNRGYNKVDVKIPGKQLLSESDIDQFVTLEGVELGFYVRDNRIFLTCKATGIRLADPSDDKQNFKVKTS